MLAYRAAYSVPPLQFSFLPNRSRLASRCACGCGSIGIGACGRSLRSFLTGIYIRRNMNRGGWVKWAERRSIASNTAKLPTLLSEGSNSSSSLCECRGCCERAEYRPA